MTDRVVHLERDGAVAVIRLDRPPVNAINTAMHGQLAAAAESINADETVRAVLIHGGDSAFAGGADIKEMADRGPEDIAVFGAAFTQALDALARLRVPSVAAIAGYALGGGFELALTADFRIVADDARLGLPEITLGVIPGGGGTQRLPRLVGLSLARRMIMLGRPLRGQEAVDAGLAEEAVPAAEVVARGLAFARRLADGPTAALAAAKRCLADGMEVDMAAALRLEAAEFAGLFATDDQKRGMATFLAEGPGKAVFTGR